jgi:hypothetical protein
LEGDVVFRGLAAALALILPLVLAACDDEEPPETPFPATATATAEDLGEPDGDLKATEAANQPPTATPIPATRGCPDGINTEAACDTAEYLVRQLRGSGAEFLVNATERITVTCGVTSRVSTERICLGAAAGESRTGLIYGTKVYWVLPQDEYRERVEELPWTDLKIVGLGCPQTPDGALDCSEWFMVGLDPVPSGPIED